MLADAAQLGLEIQQHGRRDAQHHRQLALVVPHQHAEAVAQDQRRHRGRARVAVGLRRGAQIGRDHHAADQQQADGDQPLLAQRGRQVRREHAEQRSQGEGAQAGFRRRIALALEPHQQADCQRHHVARQGGELGGQPGGQVFHAGFTFGRMDGGAVVGRVPILDEFRSGGEWIY